MAQWTAQTRLNADPDEVLMLLTEPEAISRWAPITFDVVDWDGDRLMDGDRVRVEGQLVGRRLEFEVDVDQAHDGRLALTATGPIRLDVAFPLQRHAGRGPVAVYVASGRLSDDVSQHRTRDFGGADRRALCRVRPRARR